MRGEQRAARVDFVQMLDGRPRDGQPIISRRPASDFIQNNKCARPRLIQNRGGFDHLDHKGRLPARQIVGGPDAAE